MELQSDADKLDALRRSPYYFDLSEGRVEPLAALVQVEHYERGDHIWREQTPATKFTIVVEGWIKLLKWTSDEHHIAVGLFGEGDSIGHAAVLRNEDHPTEAVAVEDALLVRMQRKSFLKVIRDDPELMCANLLDATDRQFDLLRRLHDISISSAERRLASLLSHLAHQCGVRRSRDGRMVVEIPVALSRSDLAKMINTRVETAIRKMSSFREEGLVETRSDGFLIYELERLEELSASSRPLD